MGGIAIMEKPKKINLLVFLWIIVCILFIFHCISFFIGSFYYPTTNKKEQIESLFSLFESNISLIISLIIVFSIINIKKWSWLINILFSFYFLIFYGRSFIYAIGAIILRDQKPFSNYFPNLYYNLWTITSLILPVIILIIFILLFRPDVKNYLKSYNLEG